MTDLKVEARVRLVEKAVLKVIEDEHKKALDGLRDALDSGDRVSAAMPDGTPLGYVQMTVPRASVRVADEAAFTAWVQDNHPEHIETVPKVRSSYKEALIALGGVDKETGELVPGLVDVEPQLRIMPTAAARELAAESIANIRQLGTGKEG